MPGVEDARCRGCPVSRMLGIENARRNGCPPRLRMVRECTAECTPRSLRRPVIVRNAWTPNANGYFSNGYLLDPSSLFTCSPCNGRTLLRTRLSYELGGMLDVGGYDGGLRARTDAADDGEGV
ncbi:unnamed protein product [Cochlearia groenlandica]